MTAVSVIVETWNIANEPRQVQHVLARLAPQVVAAITGDHDGVELVITHAGLDNAARAALAAHVPCPITWVELPRSASYYEHKNRGFDASSGDVVAFIDGDCVPGPGWLAAMLAPIAAGAQVVAGATSYAGTLAPLANEIDFPYFDGGSLRRRFAATSATTAPTVRNFFANNVAFVRAAFAERRFPTIAPMFHGQCQVLALQFVEANIPIAYAPTARVTHAWPDGVREWLHVRLLRGADTTQLLPHVLATYAPHMRAPLRRLGPLPTLALLAIRAVTASWSAVRRGPALRGLALVAGVTAVDALGAAAAPAVYRYVAS